MPQLWAPFAFIAQLQGTTPYGRVLDAGTGPRSLPWLRSLDTEAITAVTGDPQMQRQVERLVGKWQRPEDRMIIGNWKNPELLAGEQFDTVLADNLLGAIEGFAPYFQSALFMRLRRLTAKRLYITGMEPYVVDRPEDEGGALVWEIGRYRDACLILTGQRPYREYPLDWVLLQLQRSGFRPLAARKFPVRYKDKFVNSQIALCRGRLQRMADQTLGKSLVAHGEALRSRALAFVEANGSLGQSIHHAVAAEPVERGT